MKQFLLLIALMSVVEQAEAGPLFLETFDGPDLPNTLSYISDPAFNQWTIDGSGRLLGEKIQGGGGDVQAAVSIEEFVLPVGGLRYSVDVGRPLATVPGGSNVGLVFGNYVALFHPGFPQDTGGDRGAFRLVEGLFARNVLISNTDIGFIPALDVLHHVEAFVSDQSGSLAIDISISGLGTDNQSHVFNISFIDPTPSLGAGNIGVQIQGVNPPGTNDGFFDNLQVEGSTVPEPSSLALLASGAFGLFGYGWRRRKTKMAA